MGKFFIRWCPVFQSVYGNLPLKVLVCKDYIKDKPVKMTMIKKFKSYFSVPHSLVCHKSCIQLIYAFFSISCVVTEGFQPVFIFSCIALFITLLIFVGRISFGWFKHFKPTKYRVSLDLFHNF